MASVSSLDKDLRQMRLDRYTPQAANEVRAWIEEVLGERLKSGDLLEALKDGVALCRLVNHAVSPGVKFKQSAMPFVQMENISHFLRACQMPPLNLPPHDVFLTVDLFESKDPAQVLQCISAFSRRANALKPSAFPRTLGAKSKGSVMSPQLTGSSQGGTGRPLSGLGTRERGASNVSDSSSTTWNPSKTQHPGRASPTKTDFASPTGPVSSWTTRGDEGNTAPAWNIHQYGYMGGASQGNQGVSFGARRQITSAGPGAPNIAEKERRRKEEEAEAERSRLQNEEAEHRRRSERKAEEERAQLEEERRWEEETRKRREKEKREAEDERKRWDEEQRQWKEEEENRLREEKETEARLTGERTRARGNSDARLTGQFLSQYTAEQGRKSRNVSSEVPRANPEAQRIKDLEKELEMAKERERQYEVERQGRAASDSQKGGFAQQKRDRSRSRSLPRPLPIPTREDEEKESERDFLRKQWQKQNEPEQSVPKPPRPTVEEPPMREAEQQPRPPAKPPRPTPSESIPAPKTNNGPSSRPLPNPTTHNAGATANRTDRYLMSNPAPAPVQSASHRPADYSTTTEVDLENQRRKESQAKTKAGGWASKSLLEREMERERERQREWEDSQKQTAQAVRDSKEGVGPGQTWDVHQYGFLGGDSQNKSGSGLGTSGARRQIIGPRPPP